MVQKSKEKENDDPLKKSISKKDIQKPKGKALKGVMA
jgi:hypothetical protein